MQLKAAFSGRLDKYLKANLKEAERAVTTGIKTATNNLKLQMRSQVIAANLGKRLANSWRGDVYPKQKTSLNAAGVVYARAHKILSNFEQGNLIRRRKGLWLAIPTPNVPKRLGGKRPMPGDIERAWNVKLRFVYRSNGASLLVLDNRRASYSRKTGKLRGFRKASQSALRTGRGLATVVMFWLVPQVKMPKRLHFKTASERQQRQLPKLIVENWNELK